MKIKKKIAFNKLIKTFKQFMNMNRKQQLEFIHKLELKKEEMNE